MVYECNWVLWKSRGKNVTWNSLGPCKCQECKCVCYGIRFAKWVPRFELKINGYKDQFIRSCQKTTASNRSQTQRGFINLPCIQGTSVEMTATTLNQFNINVAREPQITIGSIKKKLNKNLVKTYHPEWSVKLIVKPVTKLISVKHQQPWDQGPENTREWFSWEIRTLY